MLHAQQHNIPPEEVTPTTNVGHNDDPSTMPAEQKPRRTTTSHYPNGMQRHAVDGGGTTSQGDWRIPPEYEEDIFKDLRRELIKFGLSCDLHKRLLANMEKKCKSSPFTSEEILHIRGIFVECISDKLRQPHLNGHNTLSVVEGQPFLLELMCDICEYSGDHDTTLLPAAMEGVRTGFFSPIVSSNTWPQREPDHSPQQRQLLVCEGACF